MKRLIRSTIASVAPEMLQQVDHMRRRGLESDLIASHLTSQEAHKLHIGCGFHVLPGWLNTDYYPTDPNVAHLDATKPFPFEDATFDFVFSEHMIEHVPYLDGCNMLRECFRVLKPGGVVRISTPDLNFLIELYGSSKTEQQQKYIEWSKQNFAPWAAEANDTFIINNFMRDWGHCFIYDEKALGQAMENAGLRDIVRCVIQGSSRPELQNLENEGRAPPGFVKLETLTMEGTR